MPFYFGEVIAKSPSSRRYQTITSQIPYKCSRLFFDFNSIIHTCSAQVVSQTQEADDMLLQHAIFKAIAEYTLHLIQYTNPLELVYIAIDGVAPRAKMSQQRKRRYLSAQRNIALEDFKRQHNIPFVRWDSNCITPGTQFMKDLAVFLEDDFRKTLVHKYPHLQLYVSSAAEKGEGEHKMIRFIKSQPMPQTNLCDVVYGLDADLIMLSLTCKDNNIVLMRESNNFHFDNKNNKQAPTPFKYLVIDRLRESILDTIGIDGDDMKTNINKHLLLLDYVFLCFFLGNDFIPTLSFLKIHDGAADVLLNVYKGLEQGLIQCENDTYTINLPVLEMFLGELKNIEDEMMAKTHEHYYNMMVHPKRNFNNIVNIIRQQSHYISLKEAQNKAVKEFLNDIDKFPLRNKPVFDINPKVDPKWRNAYYHYIFGANTPELITETCKNYIEGLIWTANYYFNMESNNEWYFKYAYAPCASDLYKQSMSMSAEEFREWQSTLMSAKNENISPELQLLMVLPPQSVCLLPSYMQCIMTDIQKGCLHYYPRVFQVQTYLKTKGWECVPSLPLIDMKRLQRRLTQLQGVS